MPTKNATKLERQIAYREAFLARLSAKLADAPENWPTTRCWVEKSLLSFIAEARDELAAQGHRSPVSSKSLLAWLLRLGVARRIEIEERSLLQLELGASPTDFLDPTELLMAAAPNGVVSYFSAISYYSLTTQSVSHHHVAILEKPSASRPLDKPKRVAADKSLERRDDRSSKSTRLGQLLFYYCATPYYSTGRSARLVPGVQLRGAGPRVRLRITAYEQTLIDTLYKPFHCGGPEVVFEAWRTARMDQQIDEERLVDYLTRMNYPASTRRLAVMMRLVGYQPGRSLWGVLEVAREAIDREGEFARISLLPGVEYKTLDEDWLVLTP